MLRLHLLLRLATKMCIIGTSTVIFFMMLIHDPLRHYLSPPVSFLLYILCFALIGAAVGSIGCFPWCYANRGPLLTSEVIIDCWLGSALNAALGTLWFSILGFVLCVALDASIMAFDLGNFLPDKISGLIEAVMLSLCAAWGAGIKGVKHRSLYQFRMQLRQRMQRRAWHANLNKQRKA